MVTTVSIAALLEAAVNIAKAVPKLMEVVDEIQAKRKLRKEDVDPLRAQINELKEATRSLGAVANTLGAYISVYFDLTRIASACERLQMYVKENQADFAKKGAAPGVWSNVFWMFKDVQSETMKKYNVANINQSGLLDPKDLSKIEIYLESFRKGRDQADLCIQNQWPDKLYQYVETMAEESQNVGNVLFLQINTVLNQLRTLQ